VVAFRLKLELQRRNPIVVGRDETLAYVVGMRIPIMRSQIGVRVAAILAQHGPPRDVSTTR